MSPELSNDADGVLVCSICGQPIKAEGTWTQGHNAEPAAKGRCCTECNRQFVIPARLKEIQERGAGK